MNIYKNLNVLKNCKSVCILTHIQPDADAFSSAIVLRDFLKNHFKISIVDIFAESDIIPDNYFPILEKVHINKKLKNYNTAIMIDCPNTTRLGIYNSLFTNAKYRIVIDHHETNLKEGNINIVEKVSSTCEIIYNILNYFKFEISNKNKGKLYAGIITDTNNFTVGKITSKTFEIASKFEKSINREAIYNNFLANNSLKNMQLLSLAIQNTVTFDHNQIIISHITHEEATRFKATFEDYYGIINRLATINTAKLICFIKPKDSSYYVGMRAKQGANVAEIAKKNGGGGHIGAAAFISNKSLKEIEQLILNDFREELFKLPIKKDNIF